MKKILFILFSFSFTVSFSQNITVNETFTPQQLVEKLVTSGCVTLGNFSASGGNFGTGELSYGYFNANGSSFPFQEGILLSTGKINSAIGPNSNFSDEEIITVLDLSGLVANELKVIKKNNGKALVFINESYSNPSLSIVDMLNRTVEYTQYGSLSDEVDTTISDMNKDIYWVIKTKVFNKETYIDNIGLINMNLLTGETIFISEYPATMEGDWLSYPKESYDYLNIDINKAVEISSVNKLDSNGDGYEDFTINGRDFDGGGHLTFYAKNRGFSVN